MRVAEAELRKLKLNPEDMFVAQGTLRPGTKNDISAISPK